MKIKQLSNEIYQRYGTVTRARNCFLYTKKGVRLTDLYQEDGRAILGWQGDSAFTMFKNVLNRSQVGFFITEDKPRIEKAVSTLLNSDRTVFYFPTKQAALKVALQIAPEHTSIYKPWAEYSNYDNALCVLINPPFPWTDSTYILAVKKELITDINLDLPGTIKLPFALETGFTRAIYNLINTIPERQEKDWFIHDTILTKYWTRKGPYLYTKVPEEKYDDFVRHCLDCGIVINPDYHGTSIIPFAADKGVFTQLKNNPFEF